MDFTIVTPSFRQLEKLECCIASVADQEGVEIEHIVQDGGTPGFQEFSQKLAVRWPDRPGYRRKMISEADGGMYDAINRGLRAARGTWCAYLNCDEQYQANVLQSVQRIADLQPLRDIWVGDALIIGENGEALCQRKILPPRRWHTWTCHLAALTAATFFRRALLQEGFFFDPSYRAAADAEWFVRVLGAGKKIGRLKLVCSTFMEGEKNLGLSPIALQERERLNLTAPGWMRACSWAWVVEHRLRRWVCGCHRRTNVSYDLYPAGAEQRQCFQSRRLRTSWPGRLWQK